MTNLAPYLSANGGDSATSGSPTPPGRVRIDTESLQQDDDPFGDGDRMNDPNNSTSGGGGGSGSASGNGRQAGSNGPASTTGAPGSGSSSTGGSGQPSTGGVGQSSSAGGQSGMVGVGMPSFGAPPATPGQSSGDIRPRRSTNKNWTPSRDTIIEVPLDLVVACERDGVVIHPGGYRLTSSALRRSGALVRDLQTIVHNHALIDPSVRPKPRVQFLIEPGGSDTYQEARRQSVLSGMNWPVTLRMAGPPEPSVFPKERF